jgi:hypothetical protein
MRVDERWQDRDRTEIDGVQPGTAAHTDDPSVLDFDPPVANGRRGDRKHPRRAINGHLLGQTKLLSGAASGRVIAKLLGN